MTIEVSKEAGDVDELAELRSAIFKGRIVESAKQSLKTYRGGTVDLLASRSVADKVTGVLTVATAPVGVPILVVSSALMSGVCKIALSVDPSLKEK